MSSKRKEWLHKAVQALTDQFQVPEDFEFEDQDFYERAEALLMHAFDELEEELNTFNQRKTKAKRQGEEK